MIVRALSVALLGLLAFVVLAQDQAEGPAVVNVAENDTFGAYLVDANGMSLYMFIDEEMASDDPERMTEGVRSNAAPCREGCLQAWPPLTGEEVEPGDGVDAELLYVAEVDGTMQAVYNGWPLYYFANDSEPGQTNGQGRGRAPTIWYLLAPDGSIIETQPEG